MQRRIQFLIISLIGILVLSACGFGAEKTTGPALKLNVAPNVEEYVVGQVVSIQAIAVDQSGVARIDLRVDGQLLATVPVSPAAPNYISSHTWTPDLPGSHAIQAEAYNTDGLPSNLETLIVTVVQPQADTATEDSPAVAEQAPVQAPVEADVIEASVGDTIEPAQPQETDDTVADADPFNSVPTIVAAANLNVRTGPGLSYSVIGQLLVNEMAVVTGRNSHGTWFEIVYPADNNTRGWVTGDTQYVEGYNLQNVPLAAIPLPPTATPTATVVPPAPTSTTEPATPVPAKPTIHSFTANRYSITAGESVTLQWDLSNAQVAYLVYGGTSEGVAAPGSKIVTPATTTVYSLVAINIAGEVSANIEIVVSPAEGPDDPTGPLVPLDPGKIKPLWPTPTPTPFKVFPGIIIKPTPVPTLQLIPGLVLPKP